MVKSGSKGSFSADATKAAKPSEEWFEWIE